MLSRRHFLRSSALLSLAPALPGIFARTARAAEAMTDARTLVVIQLDGGNDGLNTLVPYTDDAYAAARVKLRLEAKDLHKLDDHMALHPSMIGAKELFDDGRLAIVQGVSYPNPNRSHFSSMRIWQTAHLVEQPANHGWLGRALDQQAMTHAALAAENSIYVGHNEVPMSLWGRRSATVSFASARDLEMRAGSDVTRDAPGEAAEGSLQQFVGQEVLTAYSAAHDFAARQQQGTRSSSASYPGTELATKLQLVSQLLQSDTKARVYYVVQTGYDTHAVQLSNHQRLLRELSGALKAFLDDLQAAKLDDRVVVLAFSEFGRRVAENNSFGTDHGAAGPVFLAGTPVRGGLIGAPPNLSDLDDGDLKMQHDFRQVYATLLDGWLGVPSSNILSDTFAPLPLLRSST